MILQRYTYKNRPPIIVIPKCGTRFVRNSKWENTDEICICSDSKENYSPITPDSIMIYRNPHEHIISAIQTDYVWGNYYGKKQHIEGNIKKSDLNVVIQNMFENNSEHWSPNLYKNIYRIWNKTDFKMVHISELTGLFDYKIEYKPELYDSHEMKHFKSKDEILSMISKDKLNELYSLCDKDELWLKRILNNEKGLSTYDVFLHQEKIISSLNTKIENQKKVISNLYAEIEKKQKVISNLYTEIEKKQKVVKKPLL